MFTCVGIHLTCLTVTYFFIVCKIYCASFVFSHFTLAFQPPRPPRLLQTCLHSCYYMYTLQDLPPMQDGRGSPLHHCKLEADLLPSIASSPPKHCKTTLLQYLQGAACNAGWTAALVRWTLDNKTRYRGFQVA